MKKLQDIWNKLSNLEHTKKYTDERSGLRIYEVCGKKFQETVSIKHIIPILEKYYEAYGERAELAKQNKNIDWKAISHAFRAAYQVRQLLTERTITFPLKEAKFLTDIKQGKVDYTTQASPILEGLMDEVEKLSETSDLPQKVDRGYWDRFIMDTIKNELKCQ